MTTRIILGRVEKGGVASWAGVFYRQSVGGRVAGSEVKVRFSGSVSVRMALEIEPSEAAERS
jgi:hypothetical protein